MVNKKADLAKNTLIITIGGLSTQIVTFLLLPLYTAYLATSAYGTIDLLTTYIVLLSPVVTIQLAMGAFRFLINARGKQEELSNIITTVVRTSAKLLTIFVVLALIILHFVRIPYGYLVLLCICTSAISGIFMQFARGLNRNSVYALGGIVIGGTIAVLNVLFLAVLHLGVRSILGSMVIANLAASIVLFWVLRLYRYIKFNAGNHKLQKVLVKYSWPLVPNSVSWWVINTADRTIIAIFLGLSSNGIYAIAYKFPTVFTTLTNYFNLSWTESAAVHINSADRDEFFSEIMSASVRFFACMAALMIAYISLVFKILINHRYHQAYNYIPILVAASVFSATVALYGAIYIAKKLTKQVGNTSIFAAVINIVLTLGLIKVIGLYGTSIATVAAYFAMTIYRHYDSKKYVTINYQKHLFIKMAALYGFACVLYYYNNSALNIINAVVVTLLCIALNRSMVMVVKEKMFARLKKLTPEQEIAAEAEEEL